MWLAHWLSRALERAAPGHYKRAAQHLFVDPFTCPSQRTEYGSLNVTVTAADIIPQVTNIWDGVTKLFLLQGGSCPVAAVTAGLAKLDRKAHV